ncbi:MAG TPA: exodeoxyribonuclease I [Nevskiaceae bacterium]|nr:exodeoxyribonuclease I [Nevskiaceae bacterium]
MRPPDRFLWHDYETFGADPARDRPAQFAALATDGELRVLGDPQVWYCQPTAEVLPHPEAVLLTGITPQRARREGLAEPDFARQVLAAFSPAGTCGAGYNTLRFDDEFTRHLLYRTFHDPYEREWRGGNSRWDLIDAVRLWQALRPEGLVWPRREDGAVSFRLEHLAAANGLHHARAHDALSDVEATLALARRLREAQPRLYAHALKLRDKRFAASLIDLEQMTPLVHVSAKIPASRGCLALMAPLAAHPQLTNAVLAFDLHSDPQALIELPLEELRERVFIASRDLPEEIDRVPVKGLHLNRVPMLAPLSTLRAEDAQRWGLDLDRAERHREQLLAARETLRPKLAALFRREPGPIPDAELALYGGGFLDAADRALLARVRSAAPEALAGLQAAFGDPRYRELLFRHRARHHPHTLDAEEARRWRGWQRRRLTRDEDPRQLTLARYQALLDPALWPAATPAQQALLAELRAWPAEAGLLDLLEQAEADEATAGPIRADATD